MANDDLNEDHKVDEQITTTTPETFKVGEKEYSTDELNKLVGLGEQAIELETKWDTKIDRLMPEFSRSREELKTLKQQRDDEAKALTAIKQDKGEELSEAEQERLIRENAKKYGLVTKEELDSHYANLRAGEKMLDKIEMVVASSTKEGKPKTDTEELLQYMVNTGIKEPEIAYEVMFRKQLKEAEMEKLQSIKPQGLQTSTGSTAGAKAPTPVVVTKDNLSSLLHEVMSRGGGQ